MTPRETDRGSGSKFKYRGRSEKDVSSRENMNDGNFDPTFKHDHAKTFKPRDGDNCIRFLPPAESWADLGHYGVDMYVHYGVGPDGRSYLCAAKMKNEPCPVCEEHRRARQAGEDEEYEKSLRPKRRVLVHLIDRDLEREGVQIWDMPAGLDKDIAGQSRIKKTGKALLIDHPEEGFDVFFKKSGSRKTTKYENPSVDRDPTPLHDDEDLQDEWLQVITDNPLPDLLLFYEYDYIKRQLEAGPPQEKGEAADGPKTRHGRGERARREPVDELPGLGDSPDPTDPDPDDRPAAGRRSRRDDPPDEQEPAAAPSGRRSRRDDPPDDDRPARSARTPSREEIEGDEADPTDPDVDPDPAPAPSRRSRREDPPADEAPAPRSRSRRDDPVEDDPPEDRPARSRETRPAADPPRRSRREDPPVEDDPPADERPARSAVRDRLRRGRD